MPRIIKSFPESGLCDGGAVDFVDRLGESCLEFGVAHRDAKVLDKCAREACDYAMIGGKTLAGVGARIAAGKGNEPRDARVIDQRLVEIGDIRKGQLEHALSTGWQRVGQLFELVEQ